ncbi:MAG TPA: hypothetical protein DCY94_03945 [Firmicutes bacterium]|nr:hypothetical protein [Bacillota bacterium]
MDGFSSLAELYNRVKPALKSKIKDLKRIGVHYVQEADVWNYLKNNVWCKKTNLALNDIVNDIMTVSNAELESYVQEILSKQKRTMENDEVSLPLERKSE